MNLAIHFTKARLESSPRLLPFEIQTINEWMAENPETENVYQNADDCFTIMWFTEGGGNLITEMQETGFGKNSLFCIRPRQAHKFQLNEGTKGYLIHFTESFLNVGELEFDLACQRNLLQFFSQSKGITIKNQAVDDMKEIVCKLTQEFSNLYLFRTEILKRYFKILLIYITRAFESNVEAVTQTRNLELVQRFIEQLDKNFKVKKMVLDYAQSLYVTPNYLNQIVKKTTGYSAGYHIRQRIVLEAKRMALYSANSMKEIGYDLGFLDCAHFSKFFKATTGSNFTDFKKEKLTVALAA